MTLLHDFLAVASAPLMITTAVVAAVSLVDAVAYLSPFVYMGIFVLVAWGLDFWKFKQYLTRRSTVKGAVLISGASSGIGLDAALRLHAAGLDIFAGVRKQEDGDALVKAVANSPSKAKMIPVILDITNQQTIDETFNKILAVTKDDGLLGVINNAAVPHWCPAELLPVGEAQAVFDVNVWGHVRVTQTMLPLLRRAGSRGSSPRVVFISSTSAFIHGKGTSAYSMSKRALEAFAAGLRLEVRLQKIQVSVVEPGPTLTQLWAKSRESTEAEWNALPEDQRARYQPLYDAEKQVVQSLVKISVPPREVTTCIDHAIFAPEAKHFYVPFGAKLSSFFLMVPSWLLDLVLSQKKAAGKAGVTARSLDLGSFDAAPKKDK